LESYKIAVVGLACRFPGANDYRRYAQNLRDGGDFITRLSRETLLSRGVSAARIDHPRYVPARGVIDDFDMFDSEFFALTSADATAMDPQHRMFFMAAWHALEDAGAASPPRRARAGVFGACSGNSYATAPADDVRDVISTGAEHLSTRLSYKLNMRGPSMTVSTACSSSLVAVTQAIQSLVMRQCDLALAGGASLRCPVEGYMYKEGSILSPDGFCRAFDVNAAGTVPGDGVGVVVLKRLDDAVQHGDTIRAIISGFGLNNDGGDKVGYSAPSIPGQVAAIAAAHTMADVHPSDIGYVEAHGTGTVLGDAVEVAALREVFDARGHDGSCALGSVKSSVGHLNAASGVAGLIKTVLSLEQSLIFPSAHVEAPHPELHTDDSPFHVSTTCKSWPLDRQRRAGVSSFGVGGTNVHLVVEAAPEPRARTARRGYWPVLISAKNPESLRLQIDDVVADLGRDIDLADAAYTLAEGREAFPYRYAVAARNAHHAIELLRTAEFGGTGSDRTLTFEFPDTTSAKAGLVRDLSARHAAFRFAWESCEASIPALNPGQWHECDPASLTCAIEYSLASLWSAHGIIPTQVTGSGVGAAPAYAFTGELSLDEALGRAAHINGDTPPSSSDRDMGIWISMAAPGEVRVDGMKVARLDGADGVIAGLGAIWQAGANVRLGPLFAEGRFRRVPLSGYRFRAQRYWVATTELPLAGVSPTEGDAPNSADNLGGPRSYDTILRHVMASWEQVLGDVPGWGDADFYDAGGDSLAAIELAELLQERLNVDVETDTVFSHPTPSALAQRITALMSYAPSENPARSEGSGAARGMPDLGGG
jgi:acyl transferase domain-containing protein